MHSKEAARLAGSPCARFGITIRSASFPSRRDGRTGTEITALSTSPASSA